MFPEWRGVVSPPEAVFVGGPVATEAVIALARRRHPDVEGFIPVVDDLGTVDLADDPLSIGASLQSLRVFSGYAGWSPDQLEAEVAQGAWFVVSADPTILSSTIPHISGATFCGASAGGLRCSPTIPRTRPSIDTVGHVHGRPCCPHDVTERVTLRIRGCVPVLTERLELRLPRESDRDRFVELFCHHDFMVFSGGVCDADSAAARFDGMLRNAAELPYAKQPVVERSTGTVLGYSGVAWFEFEGQRRFEFGYRLVPEARGRGYATEAGAAVLAIAAETFHGELLAMIDPTNRSSRRVAEKLGFTFWKQAVVDGYLDDIHRLAMD